MAALESITLLVYPRHYASSDLLSRYFLHLCYDWNLCLSQLAPAYGVTSMPFRPGCHRPFHYSVVLRSCASAVIVVARFSIRLDFFIRFCHPLDIMLQHVLTSTVIALRPFTLSLYSWCLLFVEGEGFEPPCCCRTVSVLRCHCLALLPLNLSANLPVCLAIPSQGLSNNCSTSQVLNLARCKQSLNLVPCI